MQASTATMPQLSKKPHLFLLPILLLLNILLAGKVASQQKQGCPGNCGNLTVPYPFGVTEECSFDESFLINCQQSGGNESATPLLGRTNVTVVSISLNGQLGISTSAASDCYNGLGVQTNSTVYDSNLSSHSHFQISTSKNTLFAVGCDTLGLVGSDDELNTTTGCLSLCRRDDPFLKNGVCDGIGCCKSSIPSKLSSLGWVVTYSVYNHTMVKDFNPCGYGFIAEEGSYEFNVSDLKSLGKKTFAAVVDWAVRNETCEEAKKSNLQSFACKSEHSECVDSDTGLGYLCSCSHGYQGNPYLTGNGACRDIDECLEPNICKENATCINLDGGFECPCLDGYEGDGMPSGLGCQLKVNGSSGIKTLLVITLSVSISVLGLLLGGSYMYWGVKKRKLIKMREKFFQQNGGLFLQQQIARHGGSSETAKIFTAVELMKATNNFDESRVLGQGGHGTVYQGVLPNGTVVAVKKSKICDQNQIEEFINEVIVLSQINHRNVVKLLGCCLETEVPLLVYEFITEGTLSEHIHGAQNQSSSKLSWTMRLRIAAEAAGALAYLHSATSTPIIHRDVKTTNILLDHNLTAKIADFGASRLVPLDQSQLTTLVQGTLGYLDPEYFQTSQLTEKSDVYSFGVVLAELVTSKKALSFDRPESFRNLSMYFVSSLKQGQLLHMVDKLMLDDDARVVEQIVQVADLANRCLSVKGEDRPSMKEVAVELEGLLRITGKHALRHANYMSLEETEYLLEPFSPTNVDYIGDHVSGIGTTPLTQSMNQISSSLDYCGR